MTTLTFGEQAALDSEKKRDGGGRGMKRKYRKYREGYCEDCGQEVRVTEIIFWATGLHYRVCRRCIQPYRKLILTGSLHSAAMKRAE